MRAKALRRILEANVRSAIKKDTRDTNAISRLLQHNDSMDIALTIRSLGIEKVNVDLSPTGHLIR